MRNSNGVNVMIPTYDDHIILEVKNGVVSPICYDNDDNPNPLKILNLLTETSIYRDIFEKDLIVYNEGIRYTITCYELVYLDDLYTLYNELVNNNFTVGLYTRKDLYKLKIPDFYREILVKIGFLESSDVETQNGGLIVDYKYHINGATFTLYGEHFQEFEEAIINTIEEISRKFKRVVYFSGDQNILSKKIDDMYKPTAH